MYKLSLVVILMVAFPIAMATDENFSIVLFPDTQNMVSSHQDMWRSMPKWVVDNQAKSNIKAVIGLGDVTNGGSDLEYIEAVTGNMPNNRSGWNLLKSSGLIYMPTRGNNGDYFNETRWNQYFGPKYFAGKPWFSGCYGNSTSCYYVKFAEGSQKYLVLAVGYAPTKQQIDWANKSLNLKENRDSKVIVVAHSYLGLKELTPEGETLLKGLIKQNKNIFLVVCGHMHYGETSYTSYVLRDGVNELRANYQDMNNAGDGYMMILTFQPSKGIIQTKAYSAYKKRTDPHGSYIMCMRLPTPRLVYDGKEDRTTRGTAYTYYSLSVANRNDYPAYLFTSAPDLAPCGLNKNASRTWVNIYDNQTGGYIYGFCALSKPSDMQSLWFAVAKGKTPPKSVYITLYDRTCGINSTSNPVNIK